MQDILFGITQHFYTWPYLASKMVMCATQFSTKWKVMTIININILWIFFSYLNCLWFCFSYSSQNDSMLTYESGPTSSAALFACHISYIQVVEFLVHAASHGCFSLAKFCRWTDKWRIVHMLCVKIPYVEVQQRPTEWLWLKHYNYVEVYRNPTHYQIVNALVIQAHTLCLYTRGLLSVKINRELVLCN